MEAEVMVRQVEALAEDIRASAGRFGERACGLLDPAQWAQVERVFLTGDGDSYHAACAAEMAFESIGGVACEPLSAMRFAHYAAEWMRPAAPGRVLVVAISASGGTQRVIEALHAARRYGALTVAVTGTPGSPVTQVADRTLLVDLPDGEPSPGIRTYQASLLGLLSIAPRLGRDAGVAHEEPAVLADQVDATAKTLKEECRRVAGLVADAPAMVMLGSGPSYGTALFAAAKMVEGASVFAVGQDLEEWSHVERFAYPDDMPVFVIAPPGRSHDLAAGVAARARGLGRRVIAVTGRGDTAVARHALAALPVHGQVREEFSPLLYHLFAGYVACFVAQRLGRLPFQTHRS
ncbi:glucosamine-6-phosphate deaminase [Actinomadura sp. NBRC 104425]|uniref:SIS domain-containing protein n=1 Tax=Actinomadura sp. NBRC 104425 TaxID=3032204 RepID=UPI0024A45340|nr:SIS domain-containing protein [Actinomadura sp. NBRC 104425]GLZ15417.1 glucosamine-6-phosphate deaminase [Actinomadura sp. NBRC 104425]